MDTAKRKLFEISIHAPRGGSDGVTITGMITSKKFQSTLPVGGATPILH